MKAEFFPAGDSHLLVRLGHEISEQTNNLVLVLAAGLAEKPLPGVVECVPSYCELLLAYDSARVSFRMLCRLLERRLGRLSQVPLPEGRRLDIPVRYGGSRGPDLDQLALRAGISPDETVRLHSSVEYRVFMLGFAPGFSYLGGLDSRLHCPRRAEPRLRVAAGSVGIAGSQTGIYSLASPGGWRIIGQTPLALFSPGREKPFLLAPGDRVRFRAVSEAEYLAVRAELRAAGDRARPDEKEER